MTFPFRQRHSALQLCAAVVALLTLASTATAQTQVYFQGLEAGDSWTISLGAGNVSTATGSADTPAGQRILAGTHSFQVNGSTGTLELASSSITGYTGLTLTLRASGVSTTTTGGVDTGDYVRTYVALNGGAFPSNSAVNADVAIAGNTNARWGYNATLTATTTAGTNLQVAAPQGGTSTNNYSTVVVNIPNGNSSVALRVVARASGATEIYSIDNVTLSGTVPTTAAWDANGTTSGQGGTGTWDLTNRRFTDGDLIWNNTVDGPATAVTFGSTAGTVTAGTSISFNSLSFTVTGYTIQSNTLALAGTSPSISVPTAGHSATISSNLTGSNSLTKSGAGKLTLSGATIDYTGTTTVNAGSLILDGTHSGGDSYTIASGAAMGGTGTISPTSNKSVTVNGTIAPGDSGPGKFTLATSGAGKTVFAPGGAYEWQLTDATAAAGVGWDQLSLQLLSITATTGSKFTIKVVAASPSNFNANPPAPGYYSWVIATTTGMTGFDAAEFDIDASAFSPVATGGHFMVQQSGNNLELVYVPEPGAGWVVVWFAAVSRRRHRRAAERQ